MSLSTMNFGFSLTQKQILATLSDIAIIFPVLLIIYAWWGFLEALAAKSMGDDTAQKNGFLTLNPIAHVNLVGFLILMGAYFVLGSFLFGSFSRKLLLMMVIIMGARWVIRVPIDDTKFRHYRLGGIITSLAGVIGNLLLAFTGIGLMRLMLSQSMPPHVSITLLSVLVHLVDIALYFSIISLVPLPPFDGFRLLRYILPHNAQHFLEAIEEYSFYIFLVLFFAPVISDAFFGSVFMCSAFIKKGMLRIFF